VYAATTHRFESSETDGAIHQNLRGESMTFRYSKAATEDSARHAFEFFARYLKSPQ
jgi:dienelactone hydrolase